MSRESLRFLGCWRPSLLPDGHEAFILPLIGSSTAGRRETAPRRPAPSIDLDRPTTPTGSTQLAWEWVLWQLRRDRSRLNGRVLRRHPRGQCVFSEPSCPSIWRRFSLRRFSLHYRGHLRWRSGASPHEGYQEQPEASEIGSHPETPLPGRCVRFGTLTAWHALDLGSGRLHTGG